MACPLGNFPREFPREIVEIISRCRCFAEGRCRTSGHELGLPELGSKRVTNLSLDFNLIELQQLHHNIFRAQAQSKRLAVVAVLLPLDRVFETRRALGFAEMTAERTLCSGEKKLPALNPQFEL
jgi:hypothetical protein